jgi:UDP-glucuronate 4-epimerase
MKILLTGAAGFIGFHAAQALLHRGDEVVGLDSINDYYDADLKFDRLGLLGIDKTDIVQNKVIASNKYETFNFIRMNLESRESVDALFEEERFDRVCHLAAQAGVRYSIENPYAYIDSNIYGFLNILENCRHYKVHHLIYASSSSVYGLNGKVPFSEKDGTAHPVSLYAATKKSNELMAHVYSLLFRIPATGLRFFTVYGPWGRPDMSPFLFVDAILHNRPVRVFNNGDMWRDFTYIDDIIEFVVKAIDTIPPPDSRWTPERPEPDLSSAPYRITISGTQIRLN